jgi:hypothetical protein
MDKLVPGIGIEDNSLVKISCRVFNIFQSNNCSWSAAHSPQCSQGNVKRDKYLNENKHGKIDFAPVTF